MLTWSGILSYSTPLLLASGQRHGHGPRSCWAQQVSHLPSWRSHEFWSGSLCFLKEAGWTPSTWWSAILHWIYPSQEPAAWYQKLLFPTVKSQQLHFSSGCMPHRTWDSQGWIHFYLPLYLVNLVGHWTDNGPMTMHSNNRSYTQKGQIRSWLDLPCDENYHMMCFLKGRIAWANFGPLQCPS